MRKSLSQKTLQENNFPYVGTDNGDAIGLLPELKTTQLSFKKYLVKEGMIYLINMGLGLPRLRNLVNVYMSSHNRNDPVYT